jgi:predicted helicase
LPLNCFAADNSPQDNITDWSLQQFRTHYADETLEKRDLFGYVYAVLHHPSYREKYALNLKAEFPRIPFYADFRRWAAWGKQLIDLHIGYTRLKGFPVRRIDVHPDAGKPKQNELAGINVSGKQKTLGLEVQAPKCRLKADQAAGIIEIDSVTRLEGIPPAAWQYRLGNRSALEWVLDQHRDFTPKDPTIREKFNLYRFAEHKEEVIALLGQVCQVSLETVAIIQAMPAHP